ncbi:MAG: TIGR00730 family Rossman fold protein [Bacteroidales bacterium]|nr:TIGR00730 family Rossman fold protein [Bacteroidales bacterium]
MNIAVFCGASMPLDDAYVVAAERLGLLLARRGHSLLYGGSNLGLMGILSGAVLREGGHVVGVIPRFFGSEIINSQPCTQMVLVDSMAERKAWLLAHSDAFMALPGGIGTLDEITEVMVAKQLRRFNGGEGIDARPLWLLNEGGFFNPFIGQLRTMVESGFLSPNVWQWLQTTTLDELECQL